VLYRYGCTCHSRNEPTPTPFALEWPLGSSQARHFSEWIVRVNEYERRFGLLNVSGVSRRESALQECRPERWSKVKRDVLRLFRVSPYGISRCDRPQTRSPEHYRIFFLTGAA
jgi:hypothetical protein